MPHLKICPFTCEAIGRRCRGVTLFSTQALEEGLWSVSRPGLFTPRKKQAPNIQEAGWALGAAWIDPENVAPDRPARIESL